MRSSVQLPKSAYAGIRIGKQKQKAALLIESKVETYEASKFSDIVSWLKQVALKNKSKIIAAAVHGEGDVKSSATRLGCRYGISK